MLWNVLWRNKNTFSLTFTLSFSLLGILWHKNPFARGVEFIGKLTDRMSGSLNASMQMPGNVWVKVENYRELEKRYDAAQKLLESFRLEKNKFDELKSENRKLRDAIGFNPSHEYPELKAEVLGVRINSISPRVIIDKGKQDGVEPFMPVISRAFDQDHNLIQAVVGIVASVDSGTSVVQPIIHPGFRLGVRIPDSGQWAILSGNSGSLTEVLLTYVAGDGSPTLATHSGSNMQLTRGQTIVTSGAGGLFPKGIPVGTLLREGEKLGEFKTAYVRTFAAIDSLDYVTIIMKKPDSWAQQWDRKTDWAEDLMTEFGPPVYSEELKTKTKPQTPQKKNSHPAPSGSAGQNRPAQNGNSDEGMEEDQAPGTSPEPRRIQNINIPAPGNQ